MGEPLKRRARLRSCRKILKSNERERYPQNAPGDFYVEKDVCLMCMMPEVQAPELMGFDKQEWNFYFKRQPETPAELERAIAAITYSEVQGLRYAGNDQSVLRRLVEAGASDCCDILSTPNDKSQEPSRDFLSRCLRRFMKSK